MNAVAACWLAIPSFSFEIITKIQFKNMKDAFLAKSLSIFSMSHEQSPRKHCSKIARIPAWIAAETIFKKIKESTWHWSIMRYTSYSGSKSSLWGQSKCARILDSQARRCIRQRRYNRPSPVLRLWAKIQAVGQEARTCKAVEKPTSKSLASPKGSAGLF